MPSVADLVGQLDSAGDHSVKALDQLADTLDSVDFAKTAAGNEALAQAQKNLQAQMMRLKEQAEENIKFNRELLKSGKISGKRAHQMSVRQATAMSELNAAIEDLSKGEMATTKSLGTMSKRIEDVNKGLLEENNLQHKANLELRSWIINQKRQAKAWIKSSKRIGEASDGIEKLSSNLESYTGDFIVNAGKEAAARSGNKKAIMGMGVVGLLVGFLAKLTAGRQQDLDAFSPKAFNYGLQGYADLNEAIVGTNDALTKFRDDALKLSVEAEQAEQLFTEVGRATGETNKSIIAAGPIIFRAIQAGIIPAGEAAAALSERINTVGISARDAALEIEDIGIIAKGVGSVQMEDLYKSVTNVANASDALVTNQRDLAKVMGSLVRQGDKLEMSYNRRVRAAEALTRALGSGYNQGFATLEIENDLAIAQQARARLGRDATKAEIAQANELAKRAKQIADMRKAGIIDDAKAAEMLQKIGGSTDRGIIEERMRRAAIDVTKAGGVRLAEARLGDLTPDQIAMLQRVGNALKSGASIQDIMGSDRFLSKSDRAAYKKLSKDVGKEALKGKMGMKAIANKIMNLLQNVIAPVIKYLPDMLDSIIWSFNQTTKWLKSLPFFRADTKEEKAAKRKESRDEKTREGIVSDLVALTGNKKTDLEDLFTDKDLAMSYKKIFHGFKKEQIEALRSSDYGSRHLSKVLSLVSEVGEYRPVTSKSKAGVSKGSLAPGRIKADGSQEVELRATIRMPNVTRDNEVTNGISNTARRSQDRQP